MKAHLPLLLFALVSGLTLWSQDVARLDSIRALPDDTAKVAALRDYLLIAFNTGVVTLPQIDEGIATALRAKDSTGASRMYNLRGTWFFNEGSLDSAQADYRRAGTLAAGVPDLVWRHTYDLAYAQHYAGAYEPSNLTAIELLREAEVAGDELNIAKASQLLAQNAAARDEYGEAFRYGGLAVAAARRAERPSTLSTTLAHRATVRLSLGQLEEALADAHDALSVLPAGRIYEEYAARHALAQILTARGGYDKAIREFERLHEIDPGDSDPTVLMVRSDALNYLGRYDEATADLHRAAELARQYDNPKMLSEIYLRLSMYRLTPAQLDTAAQYHERMYAYRDTVQRRANQTTSLELEERFAAAEREAEIATQQLQINRQRTQLYGVGALLLLTFGVGTIFYFLSQKLRRRNAQKERLVREKEALIGEVHHRVKNNLQVVSSLLSLHRREVADQQARDALRESQGRVQAMGLIHQKLYRTDGEATSVHMPDYLRDLGETLLDAYRLDDRVELFFDVSDISLDVDVAIPLGLIVNELVTNSLKYAFPGGREGTIEIAFHYSEDKKDYELTVTDNGVGTAAPADRATPSPAGTGFGSRLIEMLTRQLGGGLRHTAEDGYTTQLRFAS